MPAQAEQAATTHPMSLRVPSKLHRVLVEVAREERRKPASLAVLLLEEALTARGHDVAPED